MVTRLDAVDVVIVGLGAGGGPAAKVLAEAGYSVVGFDKGPWLRNSEHYSGDELKFQNRSTSVATQTAAQTKHENDGHAGVCGYIRTPEHTSKQFISWEQLHLSFSYTYPHHK